MVQIALNDCYITLSASIPECIRPAVIYDIIVTGRLHLGTRRHNVNGTYWLLQTSALQI